MKKIVMLLLCFGLSVMTVACGESAKWIDESAEKIDESITSGQFVLNDEVYEFPMDLEDWIEKGWHVSNNYDNKDTFKLDPGITSTEFELFNEEKQWVKVCVLNTSDEAVKVEECQVCYLYMDLGEVDVVFPQGMTKRSSLDEIMDAYDDPDSESEKNDTTNLCYFLEDNKDWRYFVDLEINNESKEPLESVSYNMLFFDDVWDAWVDSAGTEKACEYYIDAAMKASFTGDASDYVSSGIDSKSGAQELYDAEMYYYADFLMYYLSIDAEYVSDAIVDRFIAIAEEVLAKTKWNVKSVNVDNSNEGTVTLELYPSDYLYVIDDDISAAMDEFYLKYPDADFDAMTDAEYSAVMEEYAEMMLKAMEKNVGAAGTLDAVVKDFALDMDGAIITEEGWVEVDDIIMDIYE